MAKSVLSRRAFAGLASGFFAGHGFGIRAAEGPSERLNVAAIGIGGRGESNLAGMKGQNVVALCDVDEARAAKAFAAHPTARRFTDFRRLFDACEKQIDGVVISTPDHTHFHPAWWAIERDKHLYLEKPLAHEVQEVRRLCDAATQRGLATQLGSQRHTLPGLRAGVELVKAGTIGAVTEVHSWIASDRGMPKPLGPVTVAPSTLDWDLWLGPVPERPYRPGLAPYDWRFWWEFGTGEAGNWGCHILDIPFWALELGHPIRVAGGGPEPDPHRTPTSLVSRLDFPVRTSASGMVLPAVSLHWYQGRPPILDQRGLDLPGKDGKRASHDKNTLFIGTDGMLLCGFNGWQLLPAAEFVELKKPPQTLRPSPGFYREWFDACRGGPTATCHFGYAGPLAESVLLVNIAYRVRGEFAWDAAALTSGRADVDSLLAREYRAGWQV
ncbi:MAG: Gfo/Idh/MocA family protein [Planctomycetaceae bacterium]